MAKLNRTVEMQVELLSLKKTITNYSAYPKFLPEVVSAKIIKGKNFETAEVEFEIEVIKRFQYVLSFEVENHSIKWRLKNSNFFKINQGHWILKELGPKKTWVDYELEVDFGFLVPKWITKKLTEVSLPKMFDNFEKQALEVK